MKQFFKNSVLNFLYKLALFVFHKKKTKIITIQKFKETPSRANICIFAHYNKDSRIADYVFHHIESISKLGYLIIFVSSSNVQKKEIDKLKNIASTLIVRKNIGYDFGSWIEGYKYVSQNTQVQELILTNDSIYGPFYELHNIFQKMKSRNADFWGMTDSYEISYHIQSYFLWIGPNILRSDVWSEWIQSFVFYPSFLKGAIIQKYEIGLSKLLRSHGFTFDSYISFLDLVNEISNEEIIKRNLSDSYKNPTLFLWDFLILNFQFPYLKRDLVRSKVKRGYNRIQWVSKLKKFQTMMRLIKIDLQDL